MKMKLISILVFLSYFSFLSGQESELGFYYDDYSAQLEDTFGNKTAANITTLAGENTNDDDKDTFGDADDESDRTVPNDENTENNTETMHEDISDKVSEDTESDSEISSEDVNGELDGGNDALIDPNDDLNDPNDEVSGNSDAVSGTNDELNDANDESNDANDELNDNKYELKGDNDELEDVKDKHENNEDNLSQTSNDFNEDDSSYPDDYKNSGCQISEYGCCHDDKHPAHGPNLLGCCSYSEHGCCPDYLSDAEGPFFQGCDCKSSQYGCCPDRLTPSKGLDMLGCGCQYTEFGCCEDHKTEAPGPGLAGCSCETFRNGCCPDGVTPAQGPNLEGCDYCARLPYGCCQDELTPAAGPGFQGCGCESSQYGCCMDGSFATGFNFMGCLTIPGENCHLSPERGSCYEYQEKWYYNMDYGGCDRFWYGGCDAGQNHFNDQISCQKECVSPRGSGVCFLKRVVGPCKGNYMEWFYDAPSRSCKQFAYGGCLGNGNRFTTKEDCEDVCSPDNKIPVCNKPKAEGACTGDFQRWFFNSKSGVCEEFSYSGCLGNNNRFMSKDLCENSCKHSAKEIRTEEVCGLMLADGNCTNPENNNMVPRWGYNPLLRRCVPFYLSECGEPSINNFRTLQDCEEMCPTTFSPVISLPQGQEYLFERGRPDAVIPVSIKANPPAAVKWSLNSVEIGGIGGTAGFGAKSSNFMILPDFSLQINSVRDYDAGVYTVTADNGIGSTTSETVKVVVFPVFPTLSLDINKTIFVPGSDVSFVCKIRGYPLPPAVWSKKEHRQPDYILQNDNDHIVIETFYDSTLEMVSKLIIRSVTDADTATYSCSVQTDFSPLVKKSVSISVQYGPGERCIDRVTFAKYCPIVVKSRKCQNSYYGKYCCRSCAAAGYSTTAP